MYSNTSCTLYLKSLNYANVEIPNVFLSHRKNSAYQKDGLSYQEQAFIMAKIEGYTFTEGQDYAVEGLNNPSITNTSEATFSASMKALMATKRVYTIMSARYLEYGSSNLRHVELSCK